MKKYQVIAHNGFSINSKEEFIEKDEIEFDDRFTIFDVYDMLQLYYSKHHPSLHFKIQEVPITND